MTDLVQRFAVHLQQPLRGIRLHSVPNDPAKVPQRVRWLLDLHAQVENERQAREARRAVLERALAGIETALSEVPGVVRAKLEEVAGIATELGLALAREVVSEIVDRDLGDTASTILRCLEETVPGASARIYVAPDDLAAVTASFAEFPELDERIAAANFFTDPALGHGCVRIESDVACTTYDPRQAIENICAEVVKAVGA